jgi:hypothetical protein
MLTAKDIAKRLDLDLEQVAFLYAKRILPDGICIGGVIHFREQDIKKFEKYLRRRAACRVRGIDPDSMRGPSVPIYSTGGKARFDTRLATVNEQERERRKRSKTLANGTTPIGLQEKITLPEAAAKTNKVQ